MMDTRVWLALALLSSTLVVTMAAKEVEGQTEGYGPYYDPYEETSNLVCVRAFDVESRIRPIACVLAGPNQATVDSN